MSVNQIEEIHKKYRANYTYAALLIYQFPAIEENIDNCWRHAGEHWTIDWVLDNSCCSSNFTYLPNDTNYKVISGHMNVGKKRVSLRVMLCKCSSCTVAILWDAYFRLRTNFEVFKPELIIYILVTEMCCDNPKYRWKHNTMSYHLIYDTHHTVMMTL